MFLKLGSGSTELCTSRNILAMVSIAMGTEGVERSHRRAPDKPPRAKRESRGVVQGRQTSRCHCAFRTPKRKGEGISFVFYYLPHFGSF
jgi:hypothetical protein